MPFRWRGLLPKSLHDWTKALSSHAARSTGAISASVASRAPSSRVKSAPPLSSSRPTAQNATDEPPRRALCIGIQDRLHYRPKSSGPSRALHVQRALTTQTHHGSRSAAVRNGEQTPLPQGDPRRPVRTLARSRAARPGLGRGLKNESLLGERAAPSTAPNLIVEAPRRRDTAGEGRAEGPQRKSASPPAFPVHYPRWDSSRAQARYVRRGRPPSRIQDRARDRAGSGCPTERVPGEVPRIGEARAERQGQRPSTKLVGDRFSLASMSRAT